MNVLVAVASRHGSTTGIAERIAEVLREKGLSAEVRPVSEVADPAGYDAYVIGSAAYLSHWLKDAVRFVDRYDTLLRSRPVWLFSSGPLGADKVDANGNDTAEAARPKEFDDLEEFLDPRGTKVFFGAWDPNASAIGFAERSIRLLPAARKALPPGDFRDWADIEAWAEEIAADLTSTARSTV